MRQAKLYPYDNVPFLEERLRLQSALSFSVFRIEVADETSLFWQKPNPSFYPVPDFNPQSAWKAKWNLKDGNEVYSFNRLDRAFVQMNLGSVQMIMGKQVVALGVGQLFGAVSQTQRYPLIVIDPEYQKTEDAATLIWSGPFQLEARFLPKVTGQKEHNFHVRAKGSKGGYDLAMTAGKSDDKPFVGLETAGNIGDSVVRAELVGYQDSVQGVVQGLVGWDYVLSRTWSVQVEAFYNGFGKIVSETLDAFRHRSSPYRGKVYGGFHLTWEATPLMKWHFTTIANCNDPSALFHVFMNYSLTNNLDLLLGQYFNWGSGYAEFGGKQKTVVPGVGLGLPDITYLAIRYYF